MSENAYRQAVGDAVFYPPGATDPVRANTPFTPVTIVDPGGRPHVPLLGVLILVGIALWFHHQNRRRRR